MEWMSLRVLASLLLNGLAVSRSGRFRRVSAAFLGVLFVGAAAKADLERWTSIGPPGVHVVRAIAIDPAAPSTIYLGTSVGVFKTSDGGATWSPVLSRTSVEALAIDPKSPSTIYAAGDQIRKSTDGGKRWTLLTTGHPVTGRLVIDPAVPGTLYASGLGSFGAPSLLKTVDGGLSWLPVGDAPFSVASVGCLTIDPSKPTTIYAGTRAGMVSGTDLGGVFKSSNGATSWTAKSAGLPTPRPTIQSLAVDPASSLTLYAGSAGALFKSANGGGTWTVARSDRGAVALLVDRSAAGRVYAGGAYGVLRTTDGGASWVGLDQGLETRSVRALANDPIDPSIVYAGTDQGGFFRLTVSPEVTLAAVASLHGVAPTFFHSDVRVLNASSSVEASVTARYRCFTGPCGSADQSFRIPPRQQSLFRDIAESLFGAPESAGAVEFFTSNDIVVTSRLYTPSSPAPSVGMFVPGLGFEEAYPESVLTLLSHSTDLARGFRTNVGVYNGEEVAQTVTFSVFDSAGVLLGQASQLVAARQARQINDVFGFLGISSDIEEAYCVVRGDGKHSLFTYAAVIDNQSQDPTYISGQSDPAPAGGTWTLPAVASLHGVGGAFFHSDVRVLNTSSTASASVTARYRCFSGQCGSPVQSFLVPPRQEIVFDDIVVSLFGAPETAGAVELESEGSIVVGSRLYTPSKPGPTVGQLVAGLRPEQAFEEQVLTSLSHSPDRTRGFRTNVGIYNGEDAAQNVTFALFSGAGTLLGETSRQVEARQSYQINNIFGSLGIGTDFENAYCLVRGEQGRRLFAYAAVIDNRSQDPAFVTGEKLPTGP